MRNTGSQTPRAPAGKRPRRPALSVMIRPETAQKAQEEAEAAETTETEAGGSSARASTELQLSVGAQIRSLRLSIGLSAQDLAQKASISNGMLSKLEHGQAAPSFATLIAIAGALEVPVARLFVGHEKRSDYSLVRAGKGISVRRHGTMQGYDYQLLGHVLSG